MTILLPLLKEGFITNSEYENKLFDHLRFTIDGKDRTIMAEVGAFAPDFKFQLDFDTYLKKVRLAENEASVRKQRNQPVLTCDARSAPLNTVPPVPSLQPTPISNQQQTPRNNQVGQQSMSRNQQANQPANQYQQQSNNRYNQPTNQNNYRQNQLSYNQQN